MFLFYLSIYTQLHEVSFFSISRKTSETTSVRGGLFPHPNIDIRSRSRRGESRARRKRVSRRLAVANGQRFMRKPANERAIGAAIISAPRLPWRARTHAKQPLSFSTTRLATCVAARRHGAPAVQGRRLWRLSGPRGLHQRAAGGVRGLPREVSVAIFVRVVRYARERK